MWNSSKNKSLVEKLSAHNTKAVCLCVCMSVPLPTHACVFYCMLWKKKKKKVTLAQKIF